MNEKSQNLQNKKFKFNFRWGVCFLWLNECDLVFVRNGGHDPLMEFLCSKFTSLEKKKLYHLKVLVCGYKWFFFYWTVQFLWLKTWLSVTGVRACHNPLTLKVVNKFQNLFFLEKFKILERKRYKDI